MLALKPNNKFGNLKKININDKIYYYFGQLDQETASKPDGVGIALDEDEEFAIEGYFENGKIGNLY